MKTTAREVFNFMRPVLLLAGILGLIGTCMLAVSGCAAQRAEPAQMTSQGSPSIVINPSCRENCGGAGITTGAVSAESKTEQTTDQGQSDRLLLWAVLGVVLIAAAGLFVWNKWGRNKV